MKKVIGGMVATVLALSATGVMAGPKWELGEDSWMKLAFLGQVHASYVEDAPDEYDIFLRRGRIILAGQIAEGIKFFAETDNDKAGKNGVGSVSTDIQDAFMDIQLFGSDHWVEAGLVLLPFSFETKSSAASLLGIDYNAEAIKLVNTFVWRDYGAELHGHFLEKRIAYRVGMFDGYDSSTGNKNSGADWRVTGHVAVNILGEAETGWFMSQSRLAQEGHYISIGAGADFQGDATLVSDGMPVADGADPNMVPRDNEAYVVDVQSGFDFGNVDLTVNGAWYEWDNSAFDGTTAFVESGVKVGPAMVTGKYSLQDPDHGNDVQDYTAGLHYFAKGHNARGGVEYRFGDSADMILLGLQFLL